MFFERLLPPYLALYLLSSGHVYRKCTINQSISHVATSKKNLICSNNTPTKFRYKLNCLFENLIFGKTGMIFFGRADTKNQIEQKMNFAKFNKLPSWRPKVQSSATKWESAYLSSHAWVGNASKKEVHHLVLSPRSRFYWLPSAKACWS